MLTQRRLLVTLSFFAVLLALTIGTLASAGRADDDVTMIAPADTDTCLGCHSENVDGSHFGASAHGKLVCQMCHVGVDRFPHPEAAIKKKPACATCHSGKVADVKHSVHGAALAKKGVPANCQACHGANPHEIAPAEKLPAQATFCARCHKDQANALGRSVHAKGHGANGQAPPDCATCHGGNPHTLQSAKTASSSRVDAMCWQCHTDQTKQLMASAHGPSDSGAGSHLTCLSCHGGNPHGIAMPARTTTAHADNVCRKCHADVAARFTQSAHGHPGPKTGRSIGCFDCHGSQPHDIGHAKKMSETEKSALCERCHADQMQNLVNSAHGGPNLKGTHLNCLSCHGHDQHAVTPPAAVAPLAKESSCKACHVAAVKSLAHSVHGRANATTDAKKPTCTDCHPANPKLITADVEKTRAQVVQSCVKCHQDIAANLKDDVHMRPDKVAGDHPNCLTCHGGVGHNIQSPAKMTPKQKVEVCARCHTDDARMSRYGILPETVLAYEQTFHGKAIMQLNHTKEATCTDCHGLHGILPPNDQRSPANPKNLATVCARCHEGNRKDFAFSYASHYRFKIEKSIVIPMSRVFSQILVVGSMIALLALVMLGYRQRLCAIGDVKTASRFLEGFNGLSLMTFLIAVIILISVFIMTKLGVTDVRQHAWSAAWLLGLCLASQFLKRVLPPCEPPRREK